MATTSDFNAAWYLANNPDVAAAGIDPLTHFQQYGILENRAPNQTIFNAATGQGAATPYSDAFNFNMNNASGGLLDEFGADYLAANPDVVNGIRSGQFSSAMDHWTKAGQGEGRSWGGSYNTSLNPTTGAATYGGPGYAKEMAYVNGQGGGGGGTATGGPLTMQPQQPKPTTPFGDFDMNGFLSGIQKQMQDWQTQQTNTFNGFKSEYDQTQKYGGLFGSLNTPMNSMNTPLYSPQAKNGYGTSFAGGNNPFNIKSF